LLAPTAGDVRVAGRTVSLENIELRRVIGILPEDAALFHSLTIWEHLELSGPLYGLSRQDTRARAIQLLRHLDLERDSGTYIDEASYGMRKKCALAMALLHNPRILFSMSHSKASNLAHHATSKTCWDDAGGGLLQVPRQTDGGELGMAGVALILRYQWRAYWRRFIRTRHRAQFYLLMLALLGWSFFVRLPPSLSRAAHELAAAQTTSMDAVLWVFCVLWLFVLVEDASVSLTSRHLLTFPIDVGSLLGVRILTLFRSPVALLIALG
jgi:hypothetical protein